MTGADIIFSKVAEGAKSLEYTDFLWMLVLAAEEKGVEYEYAAKQAGAVPSFTSRLRAAFFLTLDSSVLRRSPPVKDTCFFTPQ